MCKCPEDRQEEMQAEIRVQGEMRTFGAEAQEEMQAEIMMNQ